MKSLSILLIGSFLSFNAFAINYCDVVPHLNAIELTEVSMQAAQGVPGAEEKAFNLMDIGQKLLEVCKKVEANTDAQAE